MQALMYTCWFQAFEEENERWRQDNTQEEEVTQGKQFNQVAIIIKCLCFEK